VSATANQGVARSATVTIKAESLSQTVNVKQESGDLLVGTWGLIHYESRHWRNGKIWISEDIDCNPYAPSSLWDKKFVFNHIENNSYAMTIYYWNSDSSKWIADSAERVSIQNNTFVSSVQNSDGTYRAVEIEIRSLTSEQLVLYDFERNIPESGDEFYEKVTFTRMN
jgi:putative lipoic acid-binding regulatory protein